MISTFHYQLKSVIGNDISASFFVKYSTLFIPNSLHINTLSKARQYGLEITIFGTMCEYKTIIIINTQIHNILANKIMLGLFFKDRMSILQLKNIISTNGPSWRKWLMAWNWILDIEFQGRNVHLNLYYWICYIYVYIFRWNYFILILQISWKQLSHQKWSLWMNQFVCVAFCTVMMM